MSRLEPVVDRLSSANTGSWLVLGEWTLELAIGEYWPVGWRLFEVPEAVHDRYVPQSRRAANYEFAQHSVW